MEDSQSSEATSDASLSMQLQAKPSDKICVAVDVVKRAMTRLDARLHRGYIYKKVTNGKSTIVASSGKHPVFQELQDNPAVGDKLRSH